MTNEQALEFLLCQALMALNGWKPKASIFIKARHCDFLAFQVWKWREATEQKYTGDPGLPDGIQHTFVDCSEQIGNKNLSMGDAINLAVEQLTGETN